MDNERKEWLLAQKLPQKLAKAERLKLFEGQENAVLDFIHQNGIDVLMECIKLNNSHRAKLSRIRKRIAPIIKSGRAIFLTLTFNDETLAKTTAPWRRKLVAKYLNLVAVEYVANIDFGGKNGREHYHALVLPTYGGQVDFSKWTYGAINGKRVGCEKADLRRVSKYIGKLSYHALKETTGSQKNLLYSRCPPCCNREGEEIAPNWLTMDDIDDLI